MLSKLLMLLTLATISVYISVAFTFKPLVTTKLSGTYIGAYVDFGLHEDTVTKQAIDEYQTMVGKHQAIIAFSNDWSLEQFPQEQIDIVTANHSVPLIYWNPWDRPVGAPEARNRFGFQKILSGELNAYIDSWAKQAKAYGKPIFISFCDEMSGSWFPWSGSFYGAGLEVKPGVYLGPETFKKAYKYVVDRTRKAGATNLIWVFHANNTSDPNEPWNEMKNYYPGDNYVDWLGMSAYGQQYVDQGWVTVDQALGVTYPKMAAISPTKPIMLAEFGIGEFDKGDRVKWLDEAFTRIEAGEFPRLKALVYWHEQWENGKGEISNLKVDSTQASIDLFKQHLSKPYWVGTVQ